MVQAPAGVLQDASDYLVEHEQLSIRMDKLRLAWEQFQEQGELPEDDVVSPEVVSSWQRCRARGLDPGAYRGPLLSPKELEVRRTRCHTLIEAASPFLQTLVESLKGSGFRVDLLDAELYIMAQFGDEAALREATDHGSMAGVNRSEVYSGTNAINLAALLSRPVQLVGPEHYNTRLHYWTCSATPVIGPSGDLVGVINIAGHSSLLHKHTLGMVIAVGKVVEQTLHQQELIEALEASNEYLNDVIEAMSDCLVVVSAQGRVITLNQAAAQALSIDAEEVRGIHVDEIFGRQNPFREVLRSGQRLANREMVLETRGVRHVFVGSIKPVPGKHNSPGVMAVLKRLDEARGLVKNVAGLEAHFTFADLVGESQEFKRAVHLAQQAAGLPTSILLQGESGTGKELFAQAIHNASPAKNGPFVVVNCAAIPGGLIESELFGYEGGAFTGARKEGRPGKFELADGGTVFLDEVNSMQYDMQAKLLRVLQSKTVMRVGGTTEISVNTRVVCATNRDLWQLVQEGSFREDLFYRINVLALTIPPLRGRTADIPALSRYFCQRLTRRLGTQFSMDERVIDTFLHYHWPGNVRELENLIERSAVLALSRSSARIEPEDVLSYPGLRGLMVAQTPAPEAGPEKRGHRLGDVERLALVQALEECHGNLSQAARQLGIARTTLYRKMRQYGMDVAK